MTIALPSLIDIQLLVEQTLNEDVGSGDITAQLIPAKQQACAEVISREAAVICGRPWVDAVFAQLDPALQLEWLVADGDRVAANDLLFRVEGNARAILTGERAALNILQTLCATATEAARYAELAQGSPLTILDTRKTLPGLRVAQKYAVRCGGCDNHRMGLYDAFLIKENHIAAAGSIAAAVQRAREIAPGKPVEVEVETLQELELALAVNPDIVMLDNFSLEDCRKAKTMAQGICKLEVSGNLTEQSIADYAEIGVDYLSSGALTKSVAAIDLSMRFVGI